MLSVESIKEILRPVFKEYNVKNAVLFGSYAKGNATINSDVDICVDSGLKGLKFFGLLEDVVNVLKLPVDLIDISQIDRDSRVEKEIKNTGVKIYGD
ncbi:MAG: nucleotidyltransferase domain-containing protein [Pseudobutyrivibrio sp.]|nr:nucleotidyltransferase domain-containing protein [Pseudobutyrivibrio sp.]